MVRLRIGRVLKTAGRDAADTALTSAFSRARRMRSKVYADEVSNLSSRVFPYRVPLVPRDGIELVAPAKESPRHRKSLISSVSRPR